MKNGWATKRLGDVAKTQYGLSEPMNEDGKGFKIFRMGEVQDGRLIDTGRMKFANISRDEFEKYRLRLGDVLFNRTNSFELVGKTGIFALTGDYCFASYLVRLNLDRKAVLPEFLNYFMNSDVFQTSVKEKASQSINQANINATILSNELIRFPESLAEQRRIVGILDEAFEGIATAKANAEQNLQNTRALFESHLQSVFTQRGDGWDRMTLETLLERGWIEDHMDGNHGGDYPRKEEFISEGVPYISANCVDGERVDMSRAKYLSPSRAGLLRKGFAKDNDVLFAHNATVGPIAILHTEEEKVVLGTSLTYYRCNRAHILPEYLAHYMRSFGFKTQYLQVMRQSTRNQVPITKQREFFHVIPPLDEQMGIIRQLDGLLENGQRLESLYQRKLAALDELKKSLLHRAFSGKL